MAGVAQADDPEHLARRARAGVGRQREHPKAHYADTRKASPPRRGVLYESSVDRATYEEQRDKLREELTLAELELSEARVEQFEIDSALAKAISVLNNASTLWIDASLDDRLRLQEVLFPQGLVWDGAGFQIPATCLSFYHLGPVEGSRLAAHPIDAVNP
jgi:hypothetical protein